MKKVGENAAHVKQIAVYGCVSGLVLSVLIYPIVLYCIGNSDYGYLLTSILFAMPAAAVVMLLNNRWWQTALLSVFLLCSVIETVMVVQFGSFILAGNILAVMTTNAQEASGFAANALLRVLWYFIPLVAIYVVSVIIILKVKLANSGFQSIISIMLLLASLLLSACFVTYKLRVFYKDKLTVRYYVENRIFNRPPYNVFYQSVNAVRATRIRRYISESADFCFMSQKKDSLQGREIYVMAVGESMRYDNFSMNSKYERNTTPLLSETENVVLYDNYYSAACLTMWSVPQLLTRATPHDFALNYKEKSVFLPYKETGFKTYCIVNGNLLDYETYLSDGMDSLIHVRHDSIIPKLVDSLSAVYEKTFFIVQFTGSHHPYYNYTAEYDRWHPNINTEPWTKSDSLYINAYDNTYLYSDYILSEIIKAINKPMTVSAFLYVSDHGENVTATGGGHGGDCSPVRTEYHVPLVVWYSDAWKEQYPEKERNLVAHIAEPVNSDNMFYSVIDMANISIGEEYAHPDWSIFADTLQPHDRYVLLPDGINVMPVE